MQIKCINMASGPWKCIAADEYRVSLHDSLFLNLADSQNVAR